MSAYTIKRRMIALHEAEPALDVTAVAKRLSATPNYVRFINSTCGLAIKPARMGRPVGRRSKAA